MTSDLVLLTGGHVVFAAVIPRHCE